MAEENKLVKQDDVVPAFAITIEEAQNRLNQLQTFVKSQMQKGEDYGEIPGIPKPSLFKPGAEKLLNIYGFGFEVEQTNKIEDWEKGFFHYQYKARIINKRNNTVISECEGSANSKERKFATQHAFSIVNTLQKMSQKRALVGATLAATRTSGLFTQDVEDMDANDLNGNKKPAQKTYNNARTIDVESSSSEPISQDQIATVKKLAEVVGYDLAGALRKRGKNIEELTKTDGDKLTNYLKTQSRKMEERGELVDISDYGK